MSGREPWAPVLDVMHEGTPSDARPWLVERVLSRRADGCPSRAEELKTKYGGIRTFATYEEAQAAADSANGGAP